MQKKILFIQGGGEDGYQGDQVLVDSLKTELGKEYTLRYPQLESDEEAPDFGWTKQIHDEMQGMDDDFVLVGHSLGASMILKMLSENEAGSKMVAVFLLAAPYWTGNEEWKAGLKLKPGYAEQLPSELPLYFFHCKDDEEVPFEQFEQYKAEIKQAEFTEFASGGHLFENRLEKVAKEVSGSFR
ncbi:MAG: hypothetical protein EOO88_62670 [Pedobacter sp.]|nr:MAG: hypothetical protein EOO88_62670 [Pedobacter sp.]